ncbi:hypothetical protein H6F77_09795 [Microcoleus sp. FACHB-831]|uniref:hypothetical protein n=1 Tax=Microcoleus sp. FACHB-831 TaxID=2692827 RepID=UPI001685B3AB|nr:hypothetical protein [Microcoleus sp. FACHB-831]MBD1921381.1 hypothetical protein [Microcoleus sp. FACHB-831]
MDEILIDESKLKDMLKIALIEIIKEEKEMFSELLAEAIEDIALENAIKEGENTDSVSKEAIFKMLDSQT